ncbi:MAG: diguanylate cyclase [Alphaproteobacteria bacterium]|nr:diguanylate cyclase [Alphaproteobacteria bacterium]
MGNIDIFSQQIYLFTTIFSLLTLFFSCLYATSQQEKFFAPLWLIFIGVIFDFGANAVAYFATNAYNSGESINFYVFWELSFSLFAMLFLVMASMHFLIAGGAYTWVNISLGVLGLLAIGLFVYWFPDGDIINNMRQIFPIAGSVCLSIGLWSETSGKHKNGFIISAFLMSAISLYMILKCFDIVTTNWFLGFICYTILSLSFLIIKSNILQMQVEKQEADIKKYHKKIEDIIRLSPFPIIISRLSDDKIILANNNALKLFGINAKEIERYRIKDFFVDQENRKLLAERIEREKEVQDFEVLIKTSISDAPFWLLASVNIIDYNYDVAMYAAFQDITSQKNRENLLKNQASKDPLTTLYNRRYFEDEVSKQILQLQEANIPYTIMMIDADNFKNINDAYGHKIGDKVLIELALTTEKALRDKDIVARYGGEEFVVFLPGVDVQQSAIVAERLRQSISEIEVLSDNGDIIHFTVSIGVSSSVVSDNVEILIKTADEALYQAKQNGRNRVEVFSSTDTENISKLTPHKNEEDNHHPVFDKEESGEISLIETVPDVILEDSTEKNTDYEM